MRQLMYCRRTFVSCLSLAVLSAIGFIEHVPVVWPIVAIAVGLSAANAYERAKVSHYGKE